MALDTQYVLRLEGATPSKKNNYEIGEFYCRDGKKRRGLHVKEEAQALINAQFLQLNSKWSRKPSLLHPAMSIQFCASTDAIDRDGMLTTILDILQPAPKGAGIILNDNIRYFNGRVTIEPAVLCSPGEDHVTIWLETANDRG